MKQIALSQNGIKYKGLFAFVDEEDFNWLNQWSWCVRKSGNNLYVMRNVKKNGKNKGYYMHREIMRHHDKLEDGKSIDHIDHNPLNMQKQNLRNATQAENNRNKSAAKNKTSKYLGVCIYRGNRWKSQIMVDGKQLTNGYFPLTPKGEVEAALAYNIAAQKHFGEFANLNKVA